MEFAEWLLTEPERSRAWLGTCLAAYGLILGSFANVVIARLPKGQSVVKPRSRCPRCRKTIAWYDNVPLASWVCLGGKCRHCAKPISPRYPVIEALTGLLFLAAGLRYGFTPVVLIRDCTILAMLVMVTFIDLDHRIIPDPLSIGGAVFALLTAGATPWVGWTAALLGAGIGFGLFYGLAWTYYALSGRAGLGGGDIKLLALLGAWLGWESLPAILLVSSVTGSLVGITWALASRKRGLMKFAIPYGPFLVLGGLFYYLLVLGREGGSWLRFTIPI